MGDEEVMKMTMAIISPPRRPESASRLALPRKNRGGSGSATEMEMSSIVLGFPRREQKYKTKGDPRGGAHLLGALVA